MNLTQHTIRRLLIATIAPAVLAGLAQSASAQPFDISWYTIDAGGGTSAGGAFQLSGTIGQHDAGVMSGGQYTLTGGFWSGVTETCPCACNFDTSTGLGVCDLIDFVTFAGQFATGDPCACDLDTSTGSGVCDLIDFVTFAGQFAAGCP